MNKKKRLPMTSKHILSKSEYDLRRSQIMRRPTQSRKQTELGVLWDAISSFQRNSFTRQELAKRLGSEWSTDYKNGNGSLKLHGRLGYFCQQGILRVVGQTVTSRYKCPHQGNVYQVCGDYRPWWSKRREISKRQGLERLEERYARSLNAILDNVDLRRLPNPLKTILRLRREGKTLAQIGRLHGVSRERIRQLQAKGLELATKIK